MKHQSWCQSWESWMKRVRWIGCAGAALLATTAGAQEPPIVGEMTLVIGQVKLQGADGMARTVQRGGSVRVGDRIETQAGGHLHLRFVDGGRLSIRPASVLQIEEYSYSNPQNTHSQPQQPQLGAIKFRLDEGVVRSITGTWGEAARDRFRLNTPVAAIGVKGTDFVVRAEGNQTLASVYTGAITLTPMDSGCLASVGPCINGREKLLSEDMKGQMIELNRQQPTPQLVPLVDLLARSSVRSATTVTATAAPTVVVPPASTVVSDSRAATVVTASIQSLAAAPIMPIAPPAPVQLPPEPVMVTPAPVTPPVVETPPAPPAAVEPPIMALPIVPVTPPQVRQLSWGRMPWLEKMDADTFTKSWNDAIASGDERVAGVGIGTYNLFRTPSPAGAVLTSSDVRADFRLANSTAQIVRQAGRIIEPVNVTGGTLSVDFARATFATQLGLQNAAMGTETITASGNVQSNGLLQTLNSNATVTGALTLDGKEAGYTFSKTLGSGLLYGATLWGR